MKKILMALAISMFVTTVEAAVSRITRTNGKRSDKALLGKSNNSAPIASTTFETEMPFSSGTPKERITELRRRIGQAHETINEQMQLVAALTKELTPLEVHLHHDKSNKKARA